MLCAISIGGGKASRRWDFDPRLPQARALDGSLINAGQQLTRMEVLRVYTVERGETYMPVRRRYLID
jgi:hypothetical protein